jgi:hypothetical protein
MLFLKEITRSIQDYPLHLSLKFSHHLSVQYSHHFLIDLMQQPISQLHF